MSNDNYSEYTVLINDKGVASIEECDDVISFENKKCIFKSANYLGIEDYDDDEFYIVVLWSNNINIYLEKKHYISGFSISDANNLLNKLSNKKKLIN